MQRSSSLAASGPSCIGTVPQGMKRSLCLATNSATPSLTMRAAGTAYSSATV